MHSRRSMPAVARMDARDDAALVMRFGGSLPDARARQQRYMALLDRTPLALVTDARRAALETMVIAEARPVGAGA
jgi:hypothetical protein